MKLETPPALRGTTDKQSWLDLSKWLAQVSSEINGQKIGLKTISLPPVPRLDIASDEPSWNALSKWIDILHGQIIQPPVITKTSGEGIRVDIQSPTFPWHDIIGDVRPKTTGAGTPAAATYIGGQIQQYRFVANDICDFLYHVPHDYLPGSDVHLHVHWSHNGTDITGDAVFTYYATYAKGHNQDNFDAEVTGTITYATTDITTTPRYRHRIDEVQLSTSGGSASQIDTDNIEPDGLILVRINLTTLPTITAGSLFVHTSDIHYQSTGIGTKQKEPDFYT